MTEHNLSDQPRIHLLSGILAGRTANGATHLQHGLPKAGVNSSLRYPAGLKVGSEIRQLQQDGCQPLTWNIGGMDKRKRKISHRINRQIFKKKIRGRAKFSRRTAEPLIHLGHQPMLSLSPTTSSTCIGSPSSSTTPAFPNHCRSTSRSSGRFMTCTLSPVVVISPKDVSNSSNTAEIARSYQIAGLTPSADMLSLPRCKPCVT